ncbi:MAG: thiamine pyrophosphate-binding protein [Chloroflexi bacterium]|nr:MAG: thiamine pyrophosphate-binding protein [Chloroflexota bacterium]
MTAARELPSGIVSPADASIVPAPEVPAAEVHAPEVHASAARAAVGDTVAHAVVDELLRAGVTTVFGIPGLHTLDLYEALADRPAIRHVLVRHEQSAAFAADGYARVTGHPGVCLATTGPGAFNALTALAEAWGDSSPVVLLAGQIDADLIGAAAGVLHETPDQASSFRHVTKLAACPREAGEIPRAVREALRVSVAGRPRPAYVELPTDLLGTTLPTGGSEIGPASNASAEVRPDSAAVADAGRRLASARRPLIVAGGGAIRSRAGTELARLARRLGAPVLTTVPGNGAIPADDPLFAGPIVASRAATLRLVRNSDIVVVVGSRLDAVTTARWTLPLDHIIQIDVDREVIGRTYAVEVGLVTDARTGLAALLAELGERPRSSPDERWGPAAAKRARAELRSSILPGRRAFLAAIDETRSAVPRDAIVTHDAATLNSWTAYFWPVYEPDASLFPWASASLGFALPSAIGAAVAAPGRRVIAACGDGGFLFTATELATAVRLSLPMTVMVHDDGAFSSIAAYQRDRFGRAFEADLTNPDLVAFAGSFGVPAWRVERAAELAPAMRAAVAESGPSLVAISAPVGQPW